MSAAICGARGADIRAREQRNRTVRAQMRLAISLALPLLHGERSTILEVHTDSHLPNGEPDRATLPLDCKEWVAEYDRAIDACTRALLMDGGAE